MVKGSLKKARWAALRGDYVTAADFYRLAGRLDRALHMYQRGRQHASAGEVALELGDLPLASRELERAGMALKAAELALQAGERERAARLFVDAGQAHRAAQIQEEGGRFAAAGALYEHAGSLMHAARLFLLARQPQAAARSLSKHLEEIDNPLEDAELLDTCRDCGRQLLARGFPKQAAKWLGRSGRPDEAARAWERADDPERAVRAWLDAGKPEAAAKIAARLPPGDLDPLLAAETFRAAGDWGAAASLYLEAGRPEEAATCLERLGLSAEAASAHEAAGDLVAAAASHERAGENELAAGLYSRAGAPADAARCLERCGDLPAAAAQLLEAGQTLEAAKLFEQVGDTNRAVHALQQVGDDSDEAPKAAFALGRLFESKGIDSVAVEHYRRAIAGESAEIPEAELWYRFGCVLARTGRNSDAARAFKRVVSLDYGFADAAQRLTELEQRGAGRGSAPVAALPERYAIRSELGARLPGRTFLGLDTVMDRPVLLRRFGSEVVPSPEAAERLLHDVRRAARLHHPAIAAIHEAGIDVEGVFVVQEHVAGRSLRQVLDDDGPLDVPQAVRVLTRVAEALDYSHGLGLLARNIRPETVVIPPNSEARLLDFGIGVRGSDLGGMPAGCRPPELDAGERMDPASDIFLLGALAWEMLAGSPPPVPAPGTGAPDPEAVPGPGLSVPEVLRRVIASALEPDRSTRLGSAQELLEELHGSSMLPGALLANRYEIVRELGRGGMGAVYAARDLILDEKVALKVLKGPLDELTERRFVQEIRLARQISHRNIVRVHTLERWRDLRFIVMEFIEGLDLRAWAEARHPIPLHRTVELLLGVASGLSAAHGQGIVHRDVKPENVLIDERGEPRLVDFGIARQGDVHLTREGLVVGSPAYMAPEQIRGHASDERADLYALGILAYMLIGGSEPFSSDNVAEVLRMQLEEEVPPLSSVRPGVPPALEALLLRVLQKDPNARPGSVFALSEELRAIREQMSVVLA